MQPTPPARRPKSALATRPGRGDPAGAARNGEVVAAALYTRAELALRLGIGRPGVNRLRALGARPVRFGKGLYFIGSDVIDAFRRLADQQAAPAAQIKDLSTEVDR